MSRSDQPDAHTRRPLRRQPPQTIEDEDLAPPTRLDGPAVGDRLDAAFAQLQQPGGHTLEGIASGSRPLTHDRVFPPPFVDKR